MTLREAQVDCLPMKLPHSLGLFHPPHSSHPPSGHTWLPNWVETLWSTRDHPWVETLCSARELTCKLEEVQIGCLPPNLQILLRSQDLPHPILIPVCTHLLAVSQLPTGAETHCSARDRGDEEVQVGCLHTKLPHSLRLCPPYPQYPLQTSLHIQTPCRAETPMLFQKPFQYSQT